MSAENEVIESAGGKKYLPYNSDKDAVGAAEKYTDKSLRQFQRTEIIERLRVSGTKASEAVPILAGNMHKMDMSDRHALGDLFLELVTKHNVDLSRGAEEMGRFLTETNRVLRDKIKDLFVAMGPGAEPALTRALGCVRHDRADIKMVGAEVLGAIGPICAEQAIPKIEAASKAPGLDSEVTEAFEIALARLRGEEVEEKSAEPIKKAAPAEASAEAAPGDAPSEGDAPKEETKKAEVDSSQITKALCEEMLKKARVLVVDDTANMRTLMAKAIGKSAAGVSEAQDGIQALELLKAAAKRKAPYDIIMLDLMMPRMNGVEALHAIRTDKDLKDTCVIIVSARNDKQAVGAAVKLGIHGYLLKPYRIKEVLSKIGEVLATVHLEKINA